MADKNTVTVNKAEYEQMIKLVNTASFMLRQLKVFMDRIEKGLQDTPS